MQPFEGEFETAPLATPGEFEMPRPPADRSRRDTLRAWLVGPGLLRAGSAVLRRLRPVLHTRASVIVTRHRDVLEVLERSDAFGVEQTNGRRMDALGASFVLGMDPGSRYDRERAWLDAAMRREDLTRIRADVRHWARTLLDDAASRGALDVSGEYARVIAARLVQRFFGVPGPDVPTLMRWMRTLFHDLFLNLADDDAVHARATVSARELERHLLRWIAVRREQLENEPHPDDVLGRLIRLSDDGKQGLDDDGVRRSITGLIVGALDTTNTAFCRAMDELLRRPTWLASAREAALADDVEEVGRHVFEALRFRPHNPVIVRTARRDTSFSSGSGNVRAGARVYASNLSAMFDRRAFVQPGAFRTDREAYLHFGGGTHVCYGSAINHITLPEMATALLRRSSLRRSGWLRGRLHYDGPFPDRLEVRLR